jgi:hypothetical protein
VAFLITDCIGHSNIGHPSHLHGNIEMAVKRQLDKRKVLGLLSTINSFLKLPIWPNNLEFSRAKVGLFTKLGIGNFATNTELHSHSQKINAIKE